MPDLHHDFRPDADATLRALREAYPQAGDVRIEVYDPPEGDHSLGNSDTPGVISLNGFWFAQPRPRFDEAVVAAREAGRKGLPRWHGGIGSLDGEFQRLITHEFWHHLQRALPGADEFCRRGWAVAVNDVEQAVSGYALCDADEWGAETFAALRLGGSGSPQVAQMEDFLHGGEV